jgi:Pyruvate/2-oxoacid:ferredoxin oxidoreductase delta subunit
MGTRKIIQIDENKCDGCGLCVPSCAEGAIQIIDGKAKLVADKYCDGLGACLGECPKDALKIVEREADEFDEVAVNELLKKLGREPLKHDHSEPEAPKTQPIHQNLGGGCPGSRMMNFNFNQRSKAPIESGENTVSQLSQWPVQLSLVSPQAPYFKDADLLVAADCVPFAYPDFHNKLLAGKAVAIGCPKLDNTEAYVNKLTSIIANNNIKSITIAHMEVPCCFGLLQVVNQAVAKSGKDVPVTKVNIGIQGDIK